MKIQLSLKLKAKSSKLKTRLVVVAVVLSAFSFQLAALPVSAATIQSVEDEVTVSATIGNEAEVTPVKPEDTRRFSIFGYTSPGAKVVIQNPGIHSETFADTLGVFNFKYLFLALFREDICIVGYDTENRPTPPICIPPPTEQDNKEIGPVLLPPSTSISSGNAYVGDTITLTGQTIPNADVKLSLFTDELKQNTLSFIPIANAYTLPQLSLNSNKKGEYSLTLPTAGSQFMRMFTRALYEGSSTPKSLTLILDVFPVWMLLIKFFTTIFSLFKAHLLELIILTQLYFLLMWFLKHYFKPHIISKHRQTWLALRSSSLMILPHELMLPPHELALRSNLRLSKSPNMIRHY